MSTPQDTANRMLADAQFSSLVASLKEKRDDVTATQSALEMFTQLKTATEEKLVEAQAAEAALVQQVKDAIVALLTPQ